MKQVKKKKVKEIFKTVVRYLVDTLSTLFYRCCGNLELSGRIEGESKFATKNCRSVLAYLFPLLYQLSYYIIVFTVRIYYPTRNSTR